MEISSFIRSSVEISNDLDNDQLDYIINSQKISDVKNTMKSILYLDCDILYIIYDINISNMALPYFYDINNSSFLVLFENLERIRNTTTLKMSIIANRFPRGTKSS